jgi:hypothetical protein
MKVIKFCIIVMVLCNLNFANAQQFAVGVVFDDKNNNNTKDNNELGIENVAVSNGVDVVLTDINGSYKLPIGDDVIVFVIKPSSYIYPVNDLNQAQFYYIHKPKGSPKLHYPGTNPTGNLPTSIDFPLKKIDYSDNFKVAIFSDPQLFSELNGKYYGKDIVDGLISSGIKVDFGVTLGDMVNDKLDLLPVLNKETARSGIPWFHCTGNHDINFDIEDYHHSDETYEANYGPTTYAFNHGKVHFVVLNDIIYPNSYTKYSYVGGFRGEQMEFLKNSLKFVPKDHLIVLMMHIPLNNESQWGNTFLDDSRKILFEILKGYEYTFSMSGHTHTQKHHFFDKNEGWQNQGFHQHYTVGTSSGDWWSGEPKSNVVPVSIMRDGTPNGFNILQFEGNKYNYEYISASQPISYKMRLYGPKTIKANMYNGGNLYLNFFQGSVKDTAEYSINGNEWKPMVHTSEFDPYNAATRYLWDISNPMPQGNRPSAPEISTHLWKTPISTKLPLGQNSVKVRVRDMFGRIYEDAFTFEVIENDIP